MNDSTQPKLRTSEIERTLDKLCLHEKAPLRILQAILVIEHHRFDDTTPSRDEIKEVVLKQFDKAYTDAEIDSAVGKLKIYGTVTVTFKGVGSTHLGREVIRVLRRLARQFPPSYRQFIRPSYSPNRSTAVA